MKLQRMYNAHRNKAIRFTFLRAIVILLPFLVVLILRMRGRCIAFRCCSHAAHGSNDICVSWLVFSRGPGMVRNSSLLLLLLLLLFAVAIA